MNDDTYISIVGKRAENLWIDELSDKLSDHYKDAFSNLEDKLNQQKLLQLKSKALDKLFGEK